MTIAANGATRREPDRATWPIRFDVYLIPFLAKVFGPHLAWNLHLRMNIDEVKKTIQR
jgi:hypothetical protein